MKKSPLETVNERFKDKQGLVAEVRKLATDDLFLDRLNADKGLEHASNRKLLHLHETLGTVKERFGSRSKLIDQIVTLQQRAQDQDYRSSLERHPTPRLLDIFRATERRAKKAAKG